MGTDEEFKRCIQEAKNHWPLVITMRKGPTTVEFKQAMNDDRVKQMAVNKWKPLHLMIYFGRVKMIDEILSFSGRSLRKAMTLENKKAQVGDEYFPIRLAIRLKRDDIFNSLWNLAHQWSVSHLYQVLKDLKVPSMYCEEVMTGLLTDKTTQDILNFCDTRIRNELTTMIEQIIEENGIKKNKLLNGVKKLKKIEAKEMKELDENSNEDTITSEEGESNA